MPYYFMYCVSLKVTLRELQPGSPIPALKVGAFNRGQKIALEVPQPVHWNLDPDNGDMPVYFSAPALVVRREFADALKQCGVDNIDYYDVVLHDAKTGETWSDYLIANVIGDVDAIDMKASEIDPASPRTTAVLFDKIVIDESKCRGLKLFRPRHKPSSLLASKEVKDLIESKKFAFVRFVEPEDSA
jgi:hypothetical protein